MMIEFSSCNKIYKRIKGCCCQWNFIEENLIKDISFEGRGMLFRGLFVGEFEAYTVITGGKFKTLTFPSSRTYQRVSRLNHTGICSFSISKRL